MVVQQLILVGLTAVARHGCPYSTLVHGERLASIIGVLRCNLLVAYVLRHSTVYGHVWYVVVHIYIVDVLCQVWCARWIQLDIAIGHVLELLELLQLFLSRLWEHIEDGLYLLGYLAVLISPHVLLA